MAKRSKEQTVTLSTNMWDCICNALEDATDMIQQGATFKSDALTDGIDALIIALGKPPLDDDDEL
jgi:hypothetical protein